MDEPRDLLAAEPRYEEGRPCHGGGASRARLDPHDRIEESRELLPGVQRPTVPAVELAREENEGRAGLWRRRLPARQGPEHGRARVPAERFGQLEERGAVFHRLRRARLREGRFSRRAPRRAPRDPVGRAAGGHEPVAGHRSELARDGEAEEIESDPLPHLTRPGQVEEERIGRARAAGGPEDGGDRLGRSRRQAAPRAPPRDRSPPRRSRSNGTSRPGEPQGGDPECDRRRNRAPGGYGRRGRARGRRGSRA